MPFTSKNPMLSSWPYSGLEMRIPYGRARISAYWLLCMDQTAGSIQRSFEGNLEEVGPSSWGRGKER